MRQRWQRNGQHANRIVGHVQAIEIAQQTDIVGQFGDFIVAQIEDFQMRQVTA